MKRALIAALLAALFAAGGARAQTGVGKEVSAKAAQPMLDLEERWVAALTKPDVDALGAILADTYVDGDEAGGHSSKSDLLAVLKSGDLKLSSFTLSDEHVYRYGNTAVVTGVAAQTGSFKGEALAPKLRFTDTLVLRKGTWVAVASQRTALPK